MGDMGNIGAMTRAITGATADPGAAIVVGVLPGEGVGPEVVAAALKVLAVLSKHTSRRVDIRQGGAIGTEALRLHGKSLTEEAVAFADSIFADGGALFCGAGGARFVYELRARYDLFCKLTPLQPCPELSDAAALRTDRLMGVDIVAVRENSGGLYFGRERVTRGAEGVSGVEMTFGYRTDEILRILGVAGRVASARRGKVSVVVKRDGVAAISELWIDAMAKARLAGGEWDVLDIDNAAYQLIANPRQFDVMVSPNMFGDVLADCGSVLLASRGMSYSGNFSSAGHAVYQTGHGAAWDIAGSGTANPVGQILSLAMMLEESFAWQMGAHWVRKAVGRTLARGVRTPDIRGSHQAVSGLAMSDAICVELSRVLEEEA